VSADVELITYASRLGGSLAELRKVLEGPLSGVFAGVHVLPFFTPFDGADAGFDPVDHTEVDPRLGSWADVAALNQDGYRLMVDVIVNHVSSSSPQFLDWLAHGPRSASDGMFLTFGAVFPGGARDTDLLGLYRPRPGLPFTAYSSADGTRHLLWTTFTGQQIDLDVRHPATRAYLQRVLDRLAGAGVRRVRLDAVGYAVKTPGTSCFMTPETFGVISEFTGWCRERGLEVLVEVHSYYQHQIEIAERVDLVYDFALPPLVLHAITAADPGPLMSWLAIRPANAITVLDTHDGIGIIDVGADPADPARPGLLSPGQIDQLVETIHTNSGGTSRQATGAAARNLDIYQVNCTFYDALGADDGRYLLARALQLWTPGIPQIYYVGLLAGRNDCRLMESTGTGRDVNRQFYLTDDVEAEVERPVVRALLALIRLRNSHPAFDGTFGITATGPVLVATWTHGTHVAVLEAQLDRGQGVLRWTTSEGYRHAVLTGLGSLPDHDG
jgi:sucrose phosphorylase